MILSFLAPVLEYRSLPGVENIKGSKGLGLSQAALVAQVPLLGGFAFISKTGEPPFHQGS